MSRTLAAASLAALLTACGGGGGSGGDAAASPPTAPVVATAADNYFPLDSNSRWVYSTTAGPQPLVSRVTGSQTTSAGTGTAVRSVDAAAGTDDSSVYIVSASGVREYAPPEADAITRALDGTEVMRWPAHAGDTHVQVDKTIDAGLDFDGDGRSDNVTLRAEVTVVGKETVVTAAGTFDNCLHQRQTARETILPSSGRPAVNIDVTVDTWYAPNIGSVKTVVLVRGGGAADSAITETLSAYRVGPRASDTVAPAVQSVTPTAASSSGAGTVVSASFSEALDADSFVPGSFTVLDSSNQPIAGTVQVQGLTATFVAGQAWASGSYTARIGTAVQDLVGNAMAAPRSWTFVVDATAPGVVGSTPAADASEVALDASIVLQFSEAVDPATVSSSNVSFSDGFSAVPALLSVNGNQVRVTPAASLQRGRTYQLYVFNVTDVVGNVMAQGYQLQFRTTQGRFAFPVALAPQGVGTNAMAIGDVNGDNINDVVLTSYTGTDPLGKASLYVRAGRADGTLGPLMRVDIGTQLVCELDSVVIGDVNGDGRPDVVVGGNFCGAQVLHQTAAGALVPAEYLPRAGSGKLRLADLNGDGRLDMVGVGGNAAGVNVWLQNSTGTLVLASTPAAPGSPGRDIEVGDVNGDGRPDLVVAISGFVGQDVSVLLQQPDGRFVATSVLSTGSPWGASALALGDLNGDGRLDIVASTGGNSPTHVAVFYQAAGGALGPATQVATYDGPLAVRIADVDNDGRPDLLVSHQGWSAVGIYLQQATGVLAAEQRYAAPYGNFNPQSMAVGDINGDGKVDVVIAGELLRQQASAGGILGVGTGRPLGAAMARAGQRALAAGGR